MMVKGDGDGDEKDEEDEGIRPPRCPPCIRKRNCFFCHGRSLVFMFYYFVSLLSLRPWENYSENIIIHIYPMLWYGYLDAIME